MSEALSDRYGRFLPFCCPTNSVKALKETSPGRLAWSEGRRPLGVAPYSSYEPGALVVALSCDDSTINILVVIIIITFVFLFTYVSRILPVYFQCQCQKLLTGPHKCNATTIQLQYKNFLLVLQLYCTCTDPCNTMLQYKFSTTCRKLAGYLQQL